MIQKGICYYCQGNLIPAEDERQRPCHLCPTCNNQLQHIFYWGKANDLCLTLRILMEVDAKKYVLYLYPDLPATYNYDVLIQIYDEGPDQGQDFLKLSCLNQFTAHNLRENLERILKLKAFL